MYYLVLLISIFAYFILTQDLLPSKRTTMESKPQESPTQPGSKTPKLAFSKGLIERQAGVKGDGQKKRIAVLGGSFNPVTVAHLDVRSPPS